MVKKRFRHLLLCLAVLLMLPQWSGVAAAAEPAPDTADSMSASTTGVSEVSNFYNVIMKTGADPWVYKHTDGYYYNAFANASGVMIRRAKTISGIEAGERRLTWSPVKDTMYSSNVWAPEMHYLKDTDGSYKWYIYFAADNGTNANHRMYVLENASDNPMTGTWEFKGKITDPTDRWAIDGTVLTVGGQHYFIWSGWEETDGSFQNLYIAEMSDPRTISSQRVLLSTPEYAWESSPGRINEGPQVEIRGDTINLVYSANGSWTDSYCLGLITAKIGDDLMNPSSWVKRDQPIFSGANGVYGPGHHSIVTSPDGTESWIIYHAARWPGSGWTRKVHTQKFTWNADGTPNLGEPVDPNTPIAIPSGEPVRQRYEAEHALLAKDPSGGNGPVVRREPTASGGQKIANIKNANDYVQFTVNVPEAGFYMLSVRNANGSPSATDASHILSVNGGPGANLGIVYSGWNRWGLSTAKVYLKQGDNTIRFSAGTNLAEIDSMDVFKFEAASELLFGSPGYTLGLGEGRSLPVYTVTGTTYSPVDSGVSFSSSNKDIADIVGNEIKGLKAGSATITAAYDGKTATAAVIVAAAPKSVQSIATGGLNNILASGQTGQLQAAARYNTHEVQDVTAGAAYSSSNPDVAKVTVTGQVYDTKPGETVIKAAYSGKEAAFNLTVTPDPSQVPQVLSQVKTPSGVTPKLPGVVDVVYKGERGTAEVSWRLEGIDLNSLGIVQVPVLLTLDGEGIPAAVSVEVIPGWGLDEIVDQVHSRIDNFSYPLGEGLGNYSRSAYDALLAKLSYAEEISTDASLTEEQFNQARSSLAQAEADLLGSLNSTQDGVFYNAYRDFSGDEIGKYPFGITSEDLTNGATATVQEEDGNKFLRLTTTATSGKANLFLPFAGEVKAGADERIVIEYRARLNTSFQYANGAMVRNDSGTGNYSLVSAFDTNKIVVQDGPSTKKTVMNSQLNTWYKIKMVANWDAKTYTVYINDAEVATDYKFRHTGGDKLTGQRFGIDGYANASIDFDDFKAVVIGGPKAAPEGLGHVNETAAGANDGRITGVNASMEWSSDNGSTWSGAADDTITNLAPGTYWVRYRETDTHKASPHVELTIQRYNQPEQPVHVIGVSLNQTSAQLYTNYGDSTVQLTANVEPDDADNKAVTWSSANSAVAAVDENGLVTVHTAGTAEIKVTTVDGGYSATCTVTVSVYTDPGNPEEPPVHVTGVSLNKTSAQLYTNYGDSTVQLTANVEPDDADNKAVTWSTSNSAVATVDENGLVTVHTAGTAEIKVTTVDGDYSATCTLTVSVYENNDSGGDNGDDPNSSGKPTVPTAPATTKNEDDSTTTTVTDQTTGTVTKTTVWPNGDREVIKTERDGTVTATITEANGSKQETVTKPDGSSHSVVTDTKGVKVETSTTSLGEVTANVHLPEGMAQARVTIPVKAASASTVAVMVHKDGTREVIKTAVRTENGLSFTAKGDMTVKLMDNKIVFQDVPASHWAAEAIAFTASRELFLGTGEGIFAPDETLSRAMLYTVLARFHGVETEGGPSWYSKAQDWATASGISDGSAPDAAITREQLITILHRYAGQPAAGNTSKSFADSGEISVWASGAMDWAVKTGILNGKPGNLLEPASVVSRAEVSAILARFAAWSSN